MSLFDMFKKQKTQNIGGDSNEINRWDDFCRLDDSFKDNPKLKPIYYLKIYGKNMIYTNSEIKEKAKSDYIRAISDNLNGDNNSTTRCLVDYLINKHEILDNKKLLDIINNLDKDSLEIIANSNSFLSYFQMKEQINTINNNEIKKIVEPLVKVLENPKMDYNIFISKYAKELKEYIYNIYNLMMNEKFETYKFNSNKSNIYFYGHKLIVICNDDEENLNFGVKKSNIVHMQKIKRLLNINNELFTKNYKEIIWNDKIPSHIENKFYNGKPYYIFKHEIYNDIEFYYREDEIEIKCNELNSKKFEIIGVKDIFKNEDIIKLYIKAIEKTIEMKEKILDTLYNFTVETCKEWEEKDKNGDEISRDYIVNHFSKIRISICPQALNKRDGYSEENTTISFAGDLYDEDGEWSLLGGHELVPNTVDGKDIECSLNG